MRALLLVLALSGCALSHEIGHDAAVDAPGSMAVLSPCSDSESAYGPTRDCGWTAVGGIPCPPGANVRVGCNDSCSLGSCSGDSMIRVCDTAPCLASNALAFDDDSCGTLCSLVDGVTCPASGELFVMTGAFNAGMPYTCSIVSH